MVESVSLNGYPCTANVGGFFKCFSFAPGSISIFDTGPSLNYFQLMVIRLDIFYSIHYPAGVESE